MNKEIASMFVAFTDENIHYYLGCKVHNLHSADDGESGEEAHGASDSWQHVHSLGGVISCDLIKCWSVERDPHQL